MAGSGFRGTSSVLLVLAVAATGGFLYWVYNQAEALDRSVTPVMEDTAAGGSGGGTLAAPDLAADVGAAVGREAMLDSVEVSQRLGRGVFIVSLSETLGYPVLLASEFIQRGTTVYGGDRVSVGGQVYTLNDSIVSEWVQRGAVDSASADQVPGVPSFLLADSVDIH